MPPVASKWVLPSDAQIRITRKNRSRDLLRQKRIKKANKIRNKLKDEFQTK